MLVDQVCVSGSAATCGLDLRPVEDLVEIDLLRCGT